MCICAWSLTHTDYALVLCTNRDEFLTRPTLNAQFHSFEEHEAEDASLRRTILSGRDVRAGGTWFGINVATGRITLLTNITEPFGKYPFSRGSLLQSFLSSDTPTLNVEEEVQNFTAHGLDYAGFNLLLLAPSWKKLSDEGGNNGLTFDAGFVTNSGARGSFTSHHLSEDARKISSFSNGIVHGQPGAEGSREWPKVRCLVHSVQEVLDRTLSSSDAPPSRSGVPGVDASSGGTNLRGADLNFANEEEEKEQELTDRLFECLAWKSPEPVRTRSELRNTVRVDPLTVPTKGLGPHSTTNVTTPSSPTSPTFSHAPIHTDIDDIATTVASDTGKEYYGTRLSTVLLVRKDGRALFIERDIWTLVAGEAGEEEPRVVLGDAKDDRVFRFQLRPTRNQHTA